MQGFIPTSASRPPQSVASINFTNLEDSETLIRAYKKKKVELEELKEQHYRLETDYFTERQRANLLEDEVQHLRVAFAKAEKQLRESQLRDSRRDTDLLSRQLDLKTKEANAY